MLLAERRRACPHGGRWEFPGGTREKNESLEKCLHRELQEELGIRVRIDEPFVVIENPYEDMPMTLHTFLCTHTGGRPRAIECKGWRWVRFEELRKENKELRERVRYLEEKLQSAISDT